MDKFIYVFSEEDKNTLLSCGYTLLKEFKPKKASTSKKKGAKDEDAEVPVKEEPKYWIFANRSARDMVFNSLGHYVFSDTLTF